MDHVTFLNGVVVNVKSLKPGGTKFESCYGPSTSHFPFVFFFVLFCLLICFAVSFLIYT